jgi:hypothetical protein
VIRKKNYAIIRVYSEASTREAADKIGQKIMGIVYIFGKIIY